MRLLIILLFIGQTIFAQKYFTRTGVTEFKASVDAFEPVEAINNSTSAILTKNGDVASQLFVSAFKFKVALMQEHFNENYMDSDTYPKAVFRGKIENFKFDNLNSKTTYTLKGKLTIRGISKEISFPIYLNKKDEKIKLTGNFNVSPKDYNIEIPSIIRKKIANKINIIINYELSEKK
ncbi:YceI family protein [Tenacibaculum sp. E3R01]|uniref:YceI family protein n=1 Tax=Tenacibaculum sp. E3R01 TaxID=2267227 RepID=UPI000DE93B1B|nr:YceI family protein [Tenacibaculum sp. E3R01]RBW55277.1 YceI family protein [Tenacibaculum sp. E3R01]